MSCKSKMFCKQSKTLYISLSCNSLKAININRAVAKHGTVIEHIDFKPEHRIFCSGLQQTLNRVCRKYLWNCRYVAIAD